MSESQYVRVPATNSHCPRCPTSTFNVEVILLCPKSGVGPSFYICRNCLFIGEVGVGPVKEEM